MGHLDKSVCWSDSKSQLIFSDCTGDRYRGLAVLRIEMSGQPALHGDYFTERQGSGKLKLTRRRRHPWWVVCTENLNPNVAVVEPAEKRV